MGLVYTTGTITGTSAANVGLLTAQKIRDDLVAHAAWELVEEYSLAAATHYVFKCLASVSGLPADFYIVQTLLLSTGQIQWFICEGYNAGTHTASKFSSGGGSSTEAFDANGSSAKTLVLPNSGISSSASLPQASQWVPSGTSTKYWLIAGDDQATVAFNGSSNGFFHVGRYVPLSVTAQPMPVQHIDHSFSNGRILRNPIVASLTKPAGALTMVGGGSSSPTGQAIGVRGDFRYTDALQSGKMPLSEVAITTADYGATNYQSVIGWFLGKQKQMLMGSQPPSGMVFGDAYNVDGKLWVPYVVSDVRIWNTGIDA